MVTKKSNLHKLGIDALKKEKYSSLTNEELVALYKQTNEEEVFNHLLAANYGLLIKIINYYDNWYQFSEDEIVALCLESFYHAVLTYNGMSKFSTYLFTGVKFYICNERKAYIGGGNSSLGEKVLAFRGIYCDFDDHSDDFDPDLFDYRIKKLVDKGILPEKTKVIDGIKNALEINLNPSRNVNAISEEEAFRDDEISAQTQYINENFKELIDGISGLDLYVFNKFFGFDGPVCSTVELADELGVSTTRIVQRINKAINKIKENMAKESYQNKKAVPEKRVKLPRTRLKPVSKETL